VAAASRRLVPSVIMLSLVGGCAAPQTRAPVFTTAASPIAASPMQPPRGVVWVVDGAGGQPEATRAVNKAVREPGVPLQVRSYEWTHGFGLGVRDMTDVEHARAQARCLAAEITAFHATSPGMPIYVVAYSAGTHVALEATRCLEADSIERIILLAPAVAADYDLRPALFAARQGIDVFTSKRDRFYLGLGPRLVGTADGQRFVPAAGRVGFYTPPLPATEALLAQRLRQHPWEDSVAWTGNVGTHAGTLNATYFRAYVLPLLSTSCDSR